MMMFASWARFQSTFSQTKKGVAKLRQMAGGLQQKVAHQSLEKARRGDPEAAYDIAERHYEGRGVKRDFQKAAEWFARSAELGNVKAKTNLGLMFLAGRGVVKNPARAKKYLKSAAEAGDVTAQSMLVKIRKSTKD